MRLFDADAIPESATAISSDGRLFVAWSEIVKAPTIDPESLRPKGRWAMDYDCGAVVYVCSICNEHYWTELESDKKPNYCPNCGAKMEG